MLDHDYVKKKVFNARMTWSNCQSVAPDLWPNLTELGFLNGEGCTTLITLKSIALHLNGFQHLEKFIIANRLALAEDVFVSSLEVWTQTGHPLPSIEVMSFRLCRCYSCAECTYHQQEEERKQNLDYWKKHRNFVCSFVLSIKYYCQTLHIVSFTQKIMIFN